MWTSTSRLPRCDITHHISTSHINITHQGIITLTKVKLAEVACESHDMNRVWCEAYPGAVVESNITLTKVWCLMKSSCRCCMSDRVYGTKGRCAAPAYACCWT
jgi:hypothetical protein